jgi:ATP phosphoribosyltransferase regulatory subunit
VSADRWLLPSGVEEVLPRDAERLEALRRAILDLYASWGYRLVIPPFIEYLDSLLTGTGKDLDLQTFKLIDQLSGRLMGVRADMTPQVARIDARHCDPRAPARLCYLGTVLHTRPDGISGSRSPVQVGAELYGHQGVESDCEVRCLMLETLVAAGVDTVHLDVGHVGVFRGLVRQAGLGEADEATLYDALQRKALPEIRALLEGLPTAGEAARMILALPELNGGDDVLDQAKSALAGAEPMVGDALDYLVRFEQELRARSPGLAVHFDLAELRGYRYHTGVVFAAFVPGHGQEIARGGRYDDIGRVFGTARPATGFSTDLKVLLAAGARHEAGRSGGILAPWSGDAALGERVAALRASGERVVQELPGGAASPYALGCDQRLVRSGDTWTVERCEDAGG